MKRVNKILKWIEWLLRQAALLLCFLAIALSLYSLVDIQSIYQKAEGISENQLLHKNDNDEIETVSEEKETQLILTDTGIDYPVMQGEDNMEYLNKDPSGNFSLAGSIFLDYRNQDDFSDTYNIIYGHHMNGSSMFGGLDRYYDLSYFNAHQNGKLIVRGVEKELYVFAIAVESGGDEFFYTPDEASIDQLMKRIEKDAYIIDRKAKRGKRMVALSTCRNGGYSTERTMIFAWLN